MEDLTSLIGNTASVPNVQCPWLAPAASTTQDPIMAFWCVYYAGHVGIALQAQDTVSCNVLAQLIQVLERMKADIGPNDAVDVGACSSAYIEKFALKMFAAADKEDREGEGDELTAKKFIAAADFLQILKVFSKIKISRSNEEKICRAKWKALDITKALGESDKLTSNLAATSLPSRHPSTSSDPTPSSKTRTPSPHAIPPPPALPPKRMTSPRATRTFVPPHLLPSDIERANAPATYTHSLPTHLGFRSGRRDTPGSWSTVATPGTVDWIPCADVEVESNHGMDSGSYSSLALSKYSDDGSCKKRVDYMGVKHPATACSSGSSSTTGSRPKNASSLSQHTRSVTPTQSTTPSSSKSGPKSEPDATVELKPAVIAKAQKHARFAISALECEDAEQSMRELRTALAVLGGRC